MNRSTEPPHGGCSTEPQIVAKIIMWLWDSQMRERFTVDLNYLPWVCVQPQRNDNLTVIYANYQLLNAHDKIYI